MRFLGLLRAFVLLGGLTISAWPGPLPAAAQGATPCPASSVAENEALVQRYWSEVWTAGGDATAPELLTPDEVHHWGIGGDTTGVAAFATRLRTFLAAFPDVRFEVGPILGEGDFVVSRWVASGTNQGPWLGMPATGRAVTWSGINVFRLACGRIAESWGEADHFALLRQLQGQAVEIPTPEPAASPAASPAAACPAASRDENVAIARRWTEDALNRADLAALDEFVADDVAYDAGLFTRFTSRDDVKKGLGALLSGFPGIQFSVDGVVADGDLVAVLWTGRGTHGGEFLGVAPTGRAVEWTGINIYRIACGKIVRGWSEVDGIGLRQQLGILPTLATPLAATPAA